MVASACVDYSTSLKDRQKAIVMGLCIGDAIAGALPYELVRPNVLASHCAKSEEENSWPLTYTEWSRPTDDTEQALLLLKTCSEATEAERKQGTYVTCERFAERLLAWMSKNPEEISKLTLSVLQLGQVLKKKRVQNWFFEASKLIYERDPEENMKNGALMRNGALASLTMNLTEKQAMDNTVSQVITTHFHPVAVLTCVLHTLLIRKGYQQTDSQVTYAVIADLISRSWRDWKNETAQQSENTFEKQWLLAVGEEKIKEAEEVLLRELKGFENFDPFHFDFSVSSGLYHTHNCSLVTLKIALWCLVRSQQQAPSTNLKPSWLPSWPFSKTGFETMVLIPLIGYDSHSYGSVSCSLLSAYFPSTLPKRYTESLQVSKDIDLLFQSL